MLAHTVCMSWKTKACFYSWEQPIFSVWGGLLCLHVITPQDPESFLRHMFSKQGTQNNMALTRWRKDSGRLKIDSSVIEVKRGQVLNKQCTEGMSTQAMLKMTQGGQKENNSAKLLKRLRSLKTTTVFWSQYFYHLQVLHKSEDSDFGGINGIIDYRKIFTLFCHLDYEYVVFYSWEGNICLQMSRGYELHFLHPPQEERKSHFHVWRGWIRVFEECSCKRL